MRFVTDCVDYGDGATYFVSGVAAVEHAGVGTVEVTFYRTVTLPNGSVENRVAARQIWDRAARKQSWRSIGSRMFPSVPHNCIDRGGAEASGPRRRPKRRRPTRQ